MKRVLGEDEQLRALILLAAACGANRLSSIVQGRVRYSELGSLPFGHNALSDHGLPIVGAVLAAALVYRRDARLAAIVAAATCALGSMLSAAGVHGPGSLVSVVGAGAFTVGSFAFAAELLVPDASHVSPSRFAGMAAFVFARVAITAIGSMAWSGVPYDLTREGLVAHGAGIVLALASVAAVAYALPRAPAETTAPAQPVYRAPSRMEAEAAPAPPRLPDVWPAVRPFVAPAALFTFSTSAVAYRMGGTSENLFGGITAITGAIYFLRVWRRREAVSVIVWYARGLTVAAAGWLLMGLGMFLGILTYLGAIVAGVGGAASGLTLGLVALAARGRAGVVLACWILLANAASSVSKIFGYAGIVLLFAGFVSFFIASGLKRSATEIEARF